MGQNEVPFSPRLEADEYEHAKQLGLLGPRFSEQDLHALFALRQRWRQGPDVCDLPPEERRLRFARWLVEHGRLSEGDGSAELDHTCSLSNAPIGSQPVAALELNGGGWRDPRAVELEHSATGRCLDADHHQGPRPAPARMQQQLRRLWGAICKVATWLLVPDDPWGRYYGYGYGYGLYPGPYPPDRPWTPLNDPRLWRHS